MLLLLNTYPLLVSQNLVFRTKQTAMVGSVKIAEAALSGLADLTEDNVAQAMSAVEETGVSRVLVTDTAGRILYDTREGDNARGLYAFYTEIAQALRGNDTFYCRYDGEAFLSRGASPVVYHNQIVGAVYAYEYDTVQAELLRSFQTNIMRISLLVALFVLFLSALLSRMFTRRISDLLQAIRQVREGAYSHRAKVTGSDEIAQLAAEFNSLTDRLQRTESARRQFVSDASHELKTPLAPHYLYLRLYKGDAIFIQRFDKKTGELKSQRIPDDYLECSAAIPGGNVIGMDNDIDGGIPFWPEYVMADGGRAQVVNADILLALREKGYLKQAPDVLNIGDEANPVVILYKFKR